MTKGWNREIRERLPPQPAAGPPGQEPAGATAQEPSREHGIGHIRGTTAYYEAMDFMAAAALLRVRGLPRRRCAVGCGFRSNPDCAASTGFAALQFPVRQASVPLFSI